MEVFTLVGVLLDITAVLVVLIPVIAGFRKGFKRRVLSLVALGVSAVVAYVVSGLFAPQIYDVYLKEKTQEVCTRAAESIDPVSMAKKVLDEKGVELPEEQVRDILSQVDSDQVQAVREAAEEYGIDEDKARELAEQFGDQLPEEAASALREQAPEIARAISSGAITDEQLTDSLRALAESPETAGQYAEETYAAPLVTSLVESLMYIVTFTAMQLIMLLVFMLFGFDLKKNPDSAGDKFGGVLIGLVGAAANLLVMCVVVTGVIKASQGVIDIDMVKSMIFMPLYKMIY